MQKSTLILLLCLMINTVPAAADVTLPDIDDKYVSVTEVNPTRDAGYVVGDILDRTVTLTIKKPYSLVKESLPIVGYEHRWRGQTTGIELAKISAEEINNNDSTTHTLHLSYQVFTSGKVAKPAALRAEIVKIRNTTNKKEVLQYRIPSFNFRISPLSVFGAVKLNEDMSQLVPPLSIDSSKQQLYLKVFAGLLGFALLGLLYIFGMNAWLPRMGAPFAKAYRDIRKLPDTEEGLKTAVARVHASLNKTAGNSLFAGNLSEFIQDKPMFAPIKKEIEQFFGLSRQVFFEYSPDVNLGESPKPWLQNFCRHLRDCERGLLPNTNKVNE